MTAEPLPALSRSNLKKSESSSFSYDVVFFSAYCKEAKSPRDLRRSERVNDVILFPLLKAGLAAVCYSAYSTAL